MRLLSLNSPRFVLSPQIGHGEFAEIYIGIHRQSNDVVAVKKVCRRTLVSTDVVALDDEIAVMRAVADSSHVVRLREVYEDSDYTHIVMERVNGIVLIEKLVEKKRFPEAEAKRIVGSLIKGVYHCHSKRIAIRNLKLESLLLVRFFSLFVLLSESFHHCRLLTNLILCNLNISAR